LPIGLARFFNALFVITAKEKKLGASGVTLVVSNLVNG